MTISRVGFASANGTSLTLPTHQAGDLIMVAAFRDGYTAGGLTAPNGWNFVTNRTAGQFNLILAFRSAATASEVSGTWTGATQIIAVVYRHSTDVLCIANQSVASAVSSTISYVAFTTASTVTDRWAVGVVGCILNTQAIESSPTGMANVTSVAGASTGELAWHDSDANIAWTTTRTVSIATSTQHGEIVAEIVSTGIAKASGGGFRSVNIRGGAEQ